MSHYKTMDETITPQEGMNPESEVIEETTAPESEDTQVVQEETVSKSQFNQVLARAKKAEDALKKVNNLAPKEENLNINNTNSTESIEALILKSQGMTNDLLDDLKAVAKARNKSLLDAQSDPIFIAIKNQKEETGKKEKARLGVSRGSGTVKQEKVLNTPGLTEADHKALWKDNNK